MTNLNIAFGNTKSHHRKTQIIRKSFMQLAVSALQCLWLWHKPKKRVYKLVEKEHCGLDVLKRCLDRGKGVLLLCAHYGHWEILGLYHGFLGISPLYSIVRHLDNPYLDNAVRDFRTISGSSVIFKEESLL